MLGGLSRQSVGEVHYHLYSGRASRRLGDRDHLAGTLDGRRADDRGPHVGAGRGTPPSSTWQSQEAERVVGAAGDPTPVLGDGHLGRVVDARAGDRQVGAGGAIATSDGHGHRLGLTRVHCHLAGGRSG